MAHDDGSFTYSRGQQERITIAFLALAWFFVALRIWTRTYVISNFGWDDSAMILASMIFTVYCAALIYIDANGGGTHVTSVPQLQLLTKWVIISEITYILAMMTLKISLGIFFGRLVVKSWQIGLIYANVGLNIFSSAASFFYCLFRCGANLDNYVAQQLYNRCTPRTLDRFMAYQQAAITTLTDVIFVLLPIFILWNANMSRRSKISVGLILCLAALGVICSILRFRYVDGLTQVQDFFWAAINISTWSTIECGASIIAGCLATLRPLIKRLCANACCSSTVKQLSQSFKSSHQSSLPRHTTEAKDGGHGEEQTMMEFLARPGEEVIAMHDARDVGRSSTERILQPGVDGVDFPWPARMGERRRQTVHVDWPLRDGVAGDGRMCGSV